MKEPKLVIVMRSDLNMSKGKIAAQAGHAAVAFLLAKVANKKNLEYTTVSFKEVEQKWMQGIQKKVCLDVSSEQELLSIYEHAKTGGLEAHLITDLGLTEFNSVATMTCVGIGPDTEEKINLVTGSLKLFK